MRKIDSAGACRDQYYLTIRTASSRPTPTLCRSSKIIVQVIKDVERRLVRCRSVRVTGYRCGEPSVQPGELGIAVHVVRDCDRDRNGKDEKPRQSDNEIEPLKPRRMCGAGQEVKWGRMLLNLVCRGRAILAQFAGSQAAA
jgi:hypothetical protein